MELRQRELRLFHALLQITVLLLQLLRAAAVGRQASIFY